MLRLSNMFLNRPVMSLRTGGQIAITTTAIINPNNLKIEGLYCIDRFNKKKEFVLLYKDIREVSQLGIIVNDHEVLSEPTELLRLQDTIKLQFNLIGKQVVTVGGSKVGKITDYATEPVTMYVQKLYASQPLLKNITGGGLTIDRNQIVEITNSRIVINDLQQAVRAPAAAVA